MNFEVPAIRYLLKPGYLIMNNDPMTVYGVLGSGMFVAIWDRKRKYSGCCIYLYPIASKDNEMTVCFGNVAINHLIDMMVTEGSKAEDLKAYLIGGGNRHEGDMGDKNQEIADKILCKRNIEIYTRDVGGKLGRKFAFDSHTGQNMTMKVHKIRNSDWYPYLVENDK